MKNILVWPSTVVTLACAFLLFVRESEIRKVRAQLAAEAEQRADAAALARGSEQERAVLQEQLAESERQNPTTARAAHPRQIRASDAEAAAALNPPPRTVSDFFKKQAVKEMMRDEAKTHTVNEVKGLFKSGLAAYLNLDEQQSGQLKELLLNRSDVLWQRFLLPMLSGDLDAAAMATEGKGIRAALEESNAQLRALVGEDGLDRYRAFEKTQPDRQHLTELAATLRDGSQAMTADQESQLLSAMNRERLAYQFDNDFSDPLKLDFEHWSANFTEDKFERFHAQQAELNARMVEQAKTILAPSQVEALNHLLEQELVRSEMTVRTTMAMTKK